MFGRVSSFMWRLDFGESAGWLEKVVVMVIGLIGREGA